MIHRPHCLGIAIVTVLNCLWLTTGCEQHPADVSARSPVTETPKPVSVAGAAALQGKKVMNDAAELARRHAAEAAAAMDQATSNLK